MKAITRGGLLDRSVNDEVFPQIGVHMTKYSQVISFTKSSKMKVKKPKKRSEQKAAGKSTNRRKPGVQLPAPSYKVIWIPPDDINVDLTSRCRPVMPRVVESLVDCIAKDGLRTPITISLLNGVAHLGVGLQRLEALKILGWSEVPCVCENDEVAAQRWQINENLCRGELTKLERANQTAALLALSSENPEEISGEKVQKAKRGRPEGGDAKAARTLKVRGKTADAKRKNIAEDRKISSIHEDAQQALVEAGLDDDGNALRAVADESTREAQLAKVKDLAKGSGNNGPSTSGDDADEADDAEPLLAVLKRAWRKAKALQAVWQKASMEDHRYLIIEDLEYPLDEETEADDDDEYDDDEHDDDHQD
jgi:ParB-like chromosome segregation protein Spo0J